MQIYCRYLLKYSAFRSGTYSRGDGSTYVTALVGRSDTDHRSARTSCQCRRTGAANVCSSSEVQIATGLAKPGWLDSGAEACLMPPSSGLGLIARSLSLQPKLRSVVRGEWSVGEKTRPRALQPPGTCRTRLYIGLSEYKALLRWTFISLLLVGTVWKI